MYVISAAETCIIRKKWKDMNVKNPHVFQLHLVMLDFGIDIPERKIKSFMLKELLLIYSSLFIEKKIPVQMELLNFAQESFNVFNVQFLHIIRIRMAETKQKKNKEIFKRKEKKKTHQHSFISRVIPFHIYMDIFSTKVSNFSVENLLVRKFIST